MALHLKNPLSLLRSLPLAIDIGSSRTVIAATTGQILLDEPTVIAYDQDAGAVAAIGTEAKSFLGKAPERIRVVRPVQAGVVLDFEALRDLLRLFLKRVEGTDGARVQLCVVVPQGITELEKRTYMDCCKAAGASKTFQADSPLAAAIGAGVDVTQPRGHFLLGLGAGLVEASIVSLASVVRSSCAKLGGDTFREAVQQHFAARFQIAMGENMAEQVAQQLSFAAPFAERRELTVTGKGSLSGTPLAIEATSADLEGALDLPLAEIEALVRSVMEQSPPDLVADVATTGLLLYGGAARLNGLDRRLAANLKLQARVAADPEYAAVRGAAAALRPDLAFRKLLLK